MNWKKTLLVALICIGLAGCNLPTSPTPAAAPSATAPEPLPTLALTVIPVQNATALPVMPTVTNAPAASNPTAGPAETQAAPAATATEPAAAPAATATAPAAPAPTSTTALLPKPTSTSGSSTSFTPFEATAAADALKLRMGPGTLFPALNLLPQGAKLSVLGISAGHEWIYVKAPSGTQGWVFVQLIETKGDLNSAPGVEPGDVQIVSGKVADKGGNPVNGVHFAFEQGGTRTDAVTGDDGVFYAFFPKSASGEWTVSYVAISAKSNMVNSSGKPQPQPQTFTLKNGQKLEFTWQ
jgi:SH3-like domain-containing protein